MNDMKRLLEELEELRKENVLLKNENSELLYKNSQLRRISSQLQAEIRNLQSNIRWSKKENLHNKVVIKKDENTRIFSVFVFFINLFFFQK